MQDKEHGQITVPVFDEDNSNTYQLSGGPGTPVRNPTERVFYSAWQHQVREDLYCEGPLSIGPLALDVLLAGAGAVGSTVLHGLWTMEVPGLLRLGDNDPEGVTDTNLNRCPIYTASSLGLPKASHARDVLYDATFEINPHDGSWERFLGTIVPTTRVLSGVDKNRVRAGIQDQYFARVLQASTLELRAEVIRAMAEGPCLRCCGPPEVLPPDEALREEGRTQPDRLAALCAEAGISVSDAKAWLEAPECGMTGEQMLPLLRRDAVEPPQFSVGFVSVAAGTLLTAELIKDYLRADVPLNKSRPRASMQFFKPAASRGATPYSRDPQRPKCIPGSIAFKAWQERFVASDRT